MTGIFISLILAAGMFGAIWGLARSRRKPAAPSRHPGRLSTAERRRLYKRLGIDPALLARQQRGNATRLNPDRSRTRA